VPSRYPERDWGIDQARGARRLATRAAPLPASLDLREPWWKVSNQSSTGACVGFAVGDGLLRWHYVKLGLLSETEPVSARFLWMASKETDDDDSRPTSFVEKAGTRVKAALDVARKYGAVRETLVPFSGRLYAGDPATFWATAARLRIEAYYNLGDDPARWRRWLFERGPIVTRLDVDDTWYAAKANGGNLDAYLEDTQKGGHAVTIVGYTPDRFIVRNSWGTTGWGDAGFGYASLSYAREAFTEAYGAVVA
jgi:C1A family cysteine protease